VLYSRDTAAAAHKEQAEHHKSAAAAHKEQAKPAVLYSRDTAGRKRVRLAQIVYTVLRVFSSRIVARVGSKYLAGLLLGHRVAWTII
jgi:hypothetical protein